VRATIIIIIALILGFSIWHLVDHKSVALLKHPSVTKTTNTVSAKPKTTPSVCVGNTIPQEIIVSITKQHLWACSGSIQSYDSPVITGMETLAADLTPVGTYKIYAKETDVYLKGSDSTGSWDDYVNYWLPFLDNQYGVYGFHDLTQAANGANGRADSDFGNINIYAPYTAAKHGSHGCVEVPLSTSAWLYNWAQIGTTVAIQA
jgi:lipoprotein-anchoring transpeptidase ErfK/SrfK